MEGKQGVLEALRRQAARLAEEAAKYRREREACLLEVARAVAACEEARRGSA